MEGGDDGRGSRRTGKPTLSEKCSAEHDGGFCIYLRLFTLQLQQEDQGKGAVQVEFLYE